MYKISFNLAICYGSKLSVGGWIILSHTTQTLYPKYSGNFLRHSESQALRSFWNRSPSSHPVGMAWNFDHLQQMLTYGEGRPTSFHVLEPCGKHAKAVQSGQDVLAAQLSNLSRKLQVHQSHLELSVPSFCLRTSPLRSTTSDNLFEGGPRHSHLWPWKYWWSNHPITINALEKTSK